MICKIYGFIKAKSEEDNKRRECILAPVIILSASEFSWLCIILTGSELTSHTDSHHILLICITVSIQYLNDATNVASLDSDHLQVVRTAFFLNYIF